MGEEEQSRAAVKAKNQTNPPSSENQVSGTGMFMASNAVAARGRGRGRGQFNQEDGLSNSLSLTGGVWIDVFVKEWGWDCWVGKKKKSGGVGFGLCKLRLVLRPLDSGLHELCGVDGDAMRALLRRGADLVVLLGFVRDSGASGSNLDFVNFWV